MLIQLMNVAEITHSRFKTKPSKMAAVLPIFYVLFKPK